MNRVRRRLVSVHVVFVHLVCLVGLLAAGAALAQSPRSTVTPVAEEGRISVASGIGFVSGIAAPGDDSAFLLDFEVDYRVAGGSSVGGLLQLGLENDFTIVSPVGYGRYTFDLGAMGASEMARIRPFVQAGLGFTYIDLDLPFPGDDDDLGFMLNFGFGVDVVLTDQLALGSKMLFNIMPDDVFNENFYYSWEIIGVRFRF